MNEPKRTRTRNVTHAQWLERVKSEPWAPRQTRIGLDWGETSTAYAVVTADGLVGAQGFINNDMPGINHLLHLATVWADPNTSERPPFVLEPTRRPLLEQLLVNGQRVLLVKSNALAARRKSQGNRAAKSDVRDAADIGEISRSQPSATHPAAQTDPQSAEIAALVRDRRHASRALVRTGNRLRSLLAEYHPVMLTAFDAQDLGASKASWAFLRAAPTHRQTVALTQEDCETIVRDVTQYRYRTTAERVHRAFQQAQPPLLYPEPLEHAMTKQALRLVDQIEQQRQAIDHLDTLITEAVAAHPLTALLGDTKGLGPGTTAAIIGFTTCRLGEFDGRRGFLAWTGTVPTVKQSGGNERHKHRDNLKSEVAQTAFTWGASVSLHHPVAKHHYWANRASGNSHGTAVRKTASNLMSALWHCATTGEAWDDNIIWATNLTPEQLAAETATNHARAKARRPAALAERQDNPRRRSLANLRGDTTPTAAIIPITGRDTQAG